jgi:thioredoxin-like negative regulator of GroEL
MKLLIVGLIVIGLVVSKRMYLQWQARLQRVPAATERRVPANLIAGADRTWVVFTTPYCATCGPVKDSLQADDPEARVVTVDATREPHLADAFEVRSAPTVLLADGDGAVRARLVGPQAVRDYLARTA